MNSGKHKSQFDVLAEVSLAKERARRRRRIRLCLYALGIILTIPLIMASVIYYLSIPGDMSIRSDWNTHVAEVRADLLPPESSEDFRAKYANLDWNAIYADIRSLRQNDEDLPEERVTFFQQVLADLSETIIYHDAEELRDFYVTMHHFLGWRVSAWRRSNSLGDADAIIAELDEAMIFSKSYITDNSSIYPPPYLLVNYSGFVREFPSNPELDEELLSRIHHFADNFVVLPVPFSKTLEDLRWNNQPKYLPTNYLTEVQLLLVEYRDLNLHQKPEVARWNPLRFKRFTAGYWNYLLRRGILKELEDMEDISTVMLPSPEYLANYPKAEHVYAIGFIDKFLSDRHIEFSLTQLALAEMAIFARQFKAEHQRWPRPDEDFRPDKSRPWLYERVMEITGCEPFQWGEESLSDLIVNHHFRLSDGEQISSAIEQASNASDRSDFQIAIRSSQLGSFDELGRRLALLEDREVIVSDVSLVYKLRPGGELLYFPLLVAPNTLTTATSPEWELYTRSARSDWRFGSDNSARHRYIGTMDYVETRVVGSAPSKTFIIYSPTGLKKYFQNKGNIPIPYPGRFIGPPDPKRYHNFIIIP